MKELVKKYLEDSKDRLSPSTIRSEGYRLGSIEHLILERNPQKLLNILKATRKPYTIATTWVNVVSFVDWCLANQYLHGVNEFKAYKKKHQKKFANCYTRRPCEKTLPQVKELLEQIQDPETKERATKMLFGALRFIETKTLEDGYVVGKGGSRRKTLIDDSFQGKQSYQTFYENLRKVGLRPHDLRKVALTSLVEAGATEYELVAAAGWKNLNSALSYIRVRPERMKSLGQALKK